MTRLFINLFFIVILCFTLAVMPINTKILELFDLDELFAKEELIIEDEPKPLDDLFEPIFNVSYSINASERLYNPTKLTVILETNIPEASASLYDLEDLEMTLYKNDEIHQIFKHNVIVTSSEQTFDNDQLKITYDLTLDMKNLGLKEDGFYDLELSFTSPDKLLEKSIFKVAYRPEIDYVTNGETQNNGNFIYKAFFLNESETHLVPLYFSVKYPQSITVEVRNRLYDTPPSTTGLSSTAVIPEKTSISKLGPEYYGVFLYSRYFDGVIEDQDKAELALSALTQSLTRLPHIKKLSYFVDDTQKEGSLFEIDLSQVIEQPIQSYAYLTETNSTLKRYLVPVAVNEENIYDEVWAILSILKSGVADDKNWTQIIPPEAIVNNFIIEGTTITLDVNDSFINVYPDDEEYQKLMMNSILYSLTSIENITKVAFSLNGEIITSIAGYDFTEPMLAPPYINFIGDY